MSVNVNGTTVLSADHIQVPTSSSAPSSPAAGDMYYNTSDNKVKVYDGSDDLLENPILSDFASKSVPGDGELGPTNTPILL